MGLLDDKIVLTGDDLVTLGIVFSNVHRLKLEAKNEFPRRLSLTGRRVVYLASEIREWVAEKVGEREATAALRSEQARRGVATRKAKAPPGGP